MFNFIFKNKKSHNKKSPSSASSLVKKYHSPVAKYHNSYINLFQKQVEKFKDNVYFRYEVISNEGDIKVNTLTYGQVDLITTNLACELHKQMRKKSIVSILEDHSVYYVILLYAFFKLRIPVQMIPTDYSSDTVRSLLKQVKSKFLIYGEHYQNIKKAVSIECLPRPDFNLEELSKVPLNPEFDQILDLKFSEKDLKKLIFIIYLGYNIVYISCTCNS